MKTSNSRPDFRSIQNLKRAYAYLLRARSKMQSGMPFLINLERSFVTSHRDEFFRLLSEKLESEYAPTAPGYYFGPKSHFGLRPMSVLALADAVVYQAILNPLILGRIINSKLQNGVVFANRIGSKEKYFFKDYKRQYASFIQAQRRSFEAGCLYRIELDVQNYYPSIDHETLCSILETQFGIAVSETELLFALLSKWSEQRLGGTTKALHRGLPQGYEASDLLANAYLAPIDDFVKEKYGNRLHFFRYNDDMVLMLKSPEIVNRVIADLSSELLKLGLSLNGKSSSHKVENTEEFDRMTFAPYGEPELVGVVDNTLNIERGVQHIFDRLNNGEDVEKQVASKMKYYLRTGGIFSTPFANNAVELVFKRPEFSFHASEYLEWRAPDKSVFTEIWKRFLVQGNRLTDWQLYCVARLLGLGPKNLKNYRRWEKLVTALVGNGHWLLKILGSLIAKQHSSTWGRVSLEQLSTEFHEPIAWQYLLFLVDWSDVEGIRLPQEADSATGSSLLLIRQIYFGEITLVPEDDTPPLEPAPAVALIQDEFLALARTTHEGVRELLKRSPPEGQPTLLGYSQMDAFLHVTFGKWPALQLPMNEQNTHVLHYCIDQCELRVNRSIGVTYKEIWDYLGAVGQKNGFSVPASKKKREIKKSIDRHVAILEPKLREAFPALRKKEIWKRVTGGLIFSR